MSQWRTEYDNKADDGAPYVGPVLVTGTLQEARGLLTWIRGPNMEELKITGEIINRYPAERLGDTYTEVRKIDENSTT